MINDTIYADKTNIVRCIEAYADEARVCESLITMGYINSNGVDLAKRLKWLNSEVDRLDNKKGRRKRKNKR